MYRAKSGYADGGRKPGHWVQLIIYNDECFITANLRVLGNMREDGYFDIAGRINDGIIRCGENIFPQEVFHLSIKQNILNMSLYIAAVVYCID